MQYRNFGKTGWQVSEIGFGAWAIGADWGQVNDQDSLNALRAAIEQGVNFIDTADVYGDGRSERLVSQVIKEYPGQVFVATKPGRKLNPHTADGYNRQNLNAFIERSLQNLEVEAIDLLQLHCPPTQVYYMPEVFDGLDDLARAGKDRHYGVSVKKVEEAIPSLKWTTIVFTTARGKPSRGLIFPKGTSSTNNHHLPQLADTNTPQTTDAAGGCL